MTVEERLTRLESIVFNRYQNTLYGRQLYIVDCCQWVTAKEFNLSKDIILSRKKRMEYTWPRHVSIFLSYELSGLSMQKLAGLFQRDDHGTVFYAVNRAWKVIAAKDAASKERTLQVTVLRARIKEEVNKQWPENGTPLTPIS